MTQRREPRGSRPAQREGGAEAAGRARWGRRRRRVPRRRAWRGAAAEGELPARPALHSCAQPCPAQPSRRGVSGASATPRPLPAADGGGRVGGEVGGRGGGHASACPASCPAAGELRRAAPEPRVEAALPGPHGL